MIIQTEINNLKEVQNLLDRVIKTCVNDRDCPAYVGNEIIKVKYALEQIKEEHLEVIEYKNCANFFPKNSEEYFSADCREYGNCIELHKWKNQPSDYMRYLAGNVFEKSEYGRQCAEDYTRQVSELREKHKELKRSK